MSLLYNFAYSWSRKKDILSPSGASAKIVSCACFIIVLLSAARYRTVSVSLGWLSNPPPALSIRSPSPNANSRIAASSGNSSHYKCLPLPRKTWPSFSSFIFCSALWFCFLLPSPVSVLLSFRSISSFICLNNFKLRATRSFESWKRLLSWTPATFAMKVALAILAILVKIALNVSLSYLLSIYFSIIR